jgi:hypothetical protein
MAIIPAVPAFSAIVLVEGKTVDEYQPQHIPIVMTESQASGSVLSFPSQQKIMYALLLRIMLIYALND